MSSPRGDQLADEAEKLLGKKSLFGKSKNLQQAADKFTQAGNSYKVDRVWKRAGECHMRAAEVYIQVKEKPNAGNQGLEAAKCFEKDPQLVDETVKAYKFTADVLKENERKMFDVGQCYVDAANVLLGVDRVDEGIALLNDATTAFKSCTETSASIAKNFEQIGDLLTDKKQYIKAVEYYQKVVDIRLSNAVTQGASAQVFFKAVLSYLQTNDIVGAKKMLDEHIKKNPVFRNDFKYKFLVNITNAIDQNDAAVFEDVSSTFGRQCTVDAWTKARIDNMRHFVTGAVEDGDEAGLL